MVTILVLNQKIHTKVDNCSLGCWHYSCASNTALSHRHISSAAWQKVGSYFWEWRTIFLTLLGPEGVNTHPTDVYAMLEMQPSPELTLLSLCPVRMQFSCEIVTISDITQWYFATHPFLVPLPFFRILEWKLLFVKGSCRVQWFHRHDMKHAGLSPPASDPAQIKPSGPAAHHRQDWAWSSAGNVHGESSETLTERGVLALRCWHLVLEWVMCWDVCQPPRPPWEGSSISNFSVS